MPPQLVRRAVLAQRVEPLPAGYWTQLEDVRVPGDRHRIDLVLVGPSGVHVVLDQPREPGRPGPDAGPEPTPELCAAAETTAAVAVQVAGLLPDRYRHVVTSEVRLTGTTDAAVDVGPVLAASPEVLRHVWRHRPRVLSTSEAAAISGLLRARLEPYPVGTDGRAGGWWGWSRRRWLGAALVAATAAGGAVAAGLTGALPLPW